MSPRDNTDDGSASHDEREVAENSGSGSPAIIPAPENTEGPRGLKDDWDDYQFEAAYDYRAFLEDPREKPDGSPLSPGTRNRLLVIKAKYRHKHADRPNFRGNPKRFKIWYASKDGWRWGGIKTNLVPAFPDGLLPVYGQQLLEGKDPKTTIILAVEGEGTAEYINNVLKPVGFVAVSFSFYGAIGSPENVRAYSCAFAQGFRTIVIPDNDRSGKLAARLLCSEFRDWRIVDLPPDTPKKWDFANYEEHKVDLYRLVEGARPLAPHEIIHADGTGDLWGADSLWYGDDRPIMVHPNKEALEAAKLCVGDKEHPWAQDVGGFVHVAIGDQMPNLAPVRDALYGRDVFLADYQLLRGDPEYRRFFSAAGAYVYQAQFPQEFGSYWDFTHPVPIEKSTGEPFRWDQFFAMYNIGANMAQILRDPEDGRRNVVVPTDFALRSFYVVQEKGMFAEVRRPYILRSKETLDNTFARWTGGAKLSEALLRDHRSQFVGNLGYNPLGAATSINDNTLTVNQFRPSGIKPIAGDLKPLWDLINGWRLPDADRQALVYWIRAVMRGEVTKWGALVVSLAQGVGKNTLAEFMSVIVGRWNTSYVTGSTIKDDRNQWAVNKCFVVASEIYEGHSWHMYNKLKTFVTEDIIRVQPLYVGAYDQENHCSFMLFSNSSKALLIDNQDRRWLVINIDNPIKRDVAYWIKLRHWFYFEGGAEALMHWVWDDEVTFPDYLNALGEAPETEAKKILVAESRPSYADDLARHLATPPVDKGPLPEIVLKSDVVAWAKVKQQGAHQDDVLRELMQAGFHRAHTQAYLKVGTRWPEDKRVPLEVWSKDGKQLSPTDVSRLIVEGKCAVFQGGIQERLKAAIAPDDTTFPVVRVAGHDEKGM